MLAAATRRIRRRRTTSVVAVTLAVAALGAVAVGVLNRGTAVVPPATLATPAVGTESSSTEKVPPTAPAISLEDTSWDLMVWSIQPHFAGVHYGQGHQTDRADGSG